MVLPSSALWALCWPPPSCWAKRLGSSPQRRSLSARVKHCCTTRVNSCGSMRSRAEVNVEGAGHLVRSRCKCSLRQPPRNRIQCAAPLSAVSPASLASRMRVSSRARGSECHAYNDHRSPFEKPCLGMALSRLLIAFLLNTHP